MPFEYTPGPDEPEVWVDYLEGIRQSLAELEHTEHEIHVELARELSGMRAGAAENARIQSAQDHAYLGIPQNGNGRASTQDPDARPTATLDVESWADFRDNSPTEISYLVNGVVPEGSLMFVAGAPKAGKTWLALALSLSVATGKAFLGRFIVPQPEPVLYLALEGHRSAIRARIGAITRGLGVDPDTDALKWLSISYRPVGLDLSDPAWAREVAEHVAIQQAKLVIVDVLRAAAPRLRESGEGAGDFGHIRAHLAPLLASGVSICLLHHFIKAGDASKARGIGERMAGSGALFGHADLVLGITGKDPRVMRVELVSRDGAAPDPFGVNLDGHGSTEFGGFGYQDTLRVIAVDDVPSEEGAWELAQPIAEFMKTVQGRMSPKTIRDTFDTTNPTLHRHRKDLEKLGVYHFDEGRFSGYEYHPSTPPWRGTGEVPVSTPPPLHPRSGGGVPGVTGGEIDDLTQLKPEWEDEL